MFPLSRIFGSLHCCCLCSLVVRTPDVRSGCRGFESRSGHLIIFPAFVRFNTFHIDIKKIQVCRNEKCSQILTLQVLVYLGF